MPSIDPIGNSYSESTPQVSKKEYSIAGILCTVHGLDELPEQAKDVSCLYLLHPRLCDKKSMEIIANLTITDWNKRLRDENTAPSQKNKGLIAVSFDQRNHGTRLVEELANEGWRQGNPRHAQDMFSIFRKTLFYLLHMCPIDICTCYYDDY